MTCTSANFYNIQPLSLSDTFHTWFDRTNEVIDVVNGVNVLSVEVGATSGLVIETGCSGGYYNGVISVDTNTAGGIGIGVPAYRFNHIVMDFADLDFAGASANPNENDYVVFSDISDTRQGAAAGTPLKIRASHMLPDRIVMGNGANGGGNLEIDANVTIVGNLDLQGDLSYIDSNDLRIEDRVIELAYARYSEFTVSGTSTAISNLVSGMTAYYNDPGEGCTTVAASTVAVTRSVSGSSSTTAVVQLHKFDTGGISDLVNGGCLFVGTSATGATYTITTTPTTVDDFYSDSTLSPAGMSIKGLSGDKNFFWTDDYNRFGVNTNLGVTGKNLWVVSANYAAYGFDDGTDRDNIFTFMGASGFETKLVLANGAITGSGTENSSWSFVKKNTPGHRQQFQVLSLEHYAGQIGGGLNDYVIANFIAGSTGTVYPGVTVTGFAQNLNVDMLDGAHAYTAPTAYSIPVAGSDGKIDPEWVSASSIRKKFVIAGHAFVTGDIVRMDDLAASLTFARADTVPTSEAIGMVSLIDGNNVTVTTQGFVTGITDGGVGRIAALGTLLTGNVYYLSPDVAGGMIVNPDSGATLIDLGDVRKAIFLSMGGTSGYVLNHPGVLVGDEDVTDKVQMRSLSPVGSVIPFAGPVSSIPPGWLLCDGRIYDKNIYDELFSAIGNVNNVLATATATATTITVSGSTRGIVAGDLLTIRWGVSNSADVVVSSINASTREVTFTTSPLTSVASGTEVKVYGRVGNGGRSTFFVPDLRGRTVFGASSYGSTDAVGLSPTLIRGQVGGEENVSLTVDNIPDHTHGTFNQTVVIDAVGVGKVGTSENTSSAINEPTAAVNGQAFDVIPPYVAIHWIIRYDRGVSAVILTGHDHDLRYIRYDDSHAISATGKAQFQANAAVLSDGTLGPDIFYDRFTVHNITGGVTSNTWDWWASGIPTTSQFTEHNRLLWNNAGLKVMGGDSYHAAINLFNNNTENYWAGPNAGGANDACSMNFWGVGVSGATAPARYIFGIHSNIANYGSNSNLVTGTNYRNIQFFMGGMTDGRTVFRIYKEEDPSVTENWNRTTRFYFDQGVTGKSVHDSTMKHLMLRNGTELVEYTGTSLSGSSVYSSGNGEFGGNISVNGSGTIGGTLGVGGNATIGGSATVSSSASIGQNLLVAGNASVAGNSTISGNETVNGNLDVQGNETISGSLSVSSSGSFGGNLSVLGSTNTKNLSVNGSLDVSQNLSVTGNMSVTGNSTIGGVLNTKGLAQFDSIVKMTNLTTSPTSTTHVLGMNLDSVVKKTFMPLSQIESFGTFCWSNSPNKLESTFAADRLPAGTWVILYNVWNARDGDGEDDNFWWPNAAKIQVITSQGGTIGYWLKNIQNEEGGGSWGGGVFCGQGFCFRIAGLENND